MSKSGLLRRRYRMMKQPLTKSQEELFKHCKGLSGFNSKDISELCGLRTSRVAQALLRIVEKGHLVRARVPAMRSDGYAASPYLYWLANTQNRKKAAKLQREYEEEKSGHRRRIAGISQEKAKLRKRIAKLEAWQELAYEVHPNIDIDIENLL